MYQPSWPLRVLSANSAVTCCSFSPTRASAAVAGLRDGNVCLWDLREDANAHLQVREKCEMD